MYKNQLKKIKLTTLFLHMLLNEILLVNRMQIVEEFNTYEYMYSVWYSKG